MKFMVFLSKCRQWFQWFRSSFQWFLSGSSGAPVVLAVVPPVVPFLVPLKARSLWELAGDGSLQATGVCRRRPFISKQIGLLASQMGACRRWEFAGDGRPFSTSGSAVDLQNGSLLPWSQCWGFMQTSRKSPEHYDTRARANDLRVMSPTPHPLGHKTHAL